LAASASPNPPIPTPLAIMSSSSINHLIREPVFLTAKLAALYLKLYLSPKGF